MIKKILPSVVCIVALSLHGCIQITNTVGSAPVPGVAAEKVKIKAKKTGAPVDYVKIQSMISSAITEAINEQLSTGALNNIPYTEQ